MTLHPFHLVHPSPWPVISGLSGLMLVLSLLKWFYFLDLNFLLFSIFSMLFSSYQWWRDVTREGTYLGFHTTKVKMGLEMGMILFIVSEVCFFFSFFWAFFHSSLTPVYSMGEIWPSLGVSPFNPFQIPLLNTVILLSSGASVTWTHYSILEGEVSDAKVSLLWTLLLGVYFTLLQVLEYWEAQFTIADSVYGGVFFVATGFHGAHVIIGTIFLSICLFRLYKSQFSPDRHFGFEAAAWYWHFVDVVWLFLFISIYWWSLN